MVDWWAGAVGSWNHWRYVTLAFHSLPPMCHALDFEHTCKQSSQTSSSSGKRKFSHRLSVDWTLLIIDACYQPRLNVCSMNYGFQIQLHIMTAQPVSHNSRPFDNGVFTPQWSHFMPAACRMSRARIYCSRFRWIWPSREDLELAWIVSNPWQPFWPTRSFLQSHIWLSFFQALIKSLTRPMVLLWSE